MVQRVDFKKNLKNIMLSRDGIHFRQIQILVFFWESIQRLVLRRKNAHQSGFCFAINKGTQRMCASHPLIKLISEGQ